MNNEEEIAPRAAWKDIVVTFIVVGVAIFIFSLAFVGAMYLITRDNDGIASQRTYFVFDICNNSQ